MTPHDQFPPEEPAAEEARALRDIWDALVAGDPAAALIVDGESGALADLAETIQSFHALDDAPPPPSGLMGDVWRQISGEPLSAPWPAAPVEPAPLPRAVPAANGHRPGETTTRQLTVVSAASSRPLTARRTRLANGVLRVYRLVAIAVIGGFAGGFAAGLGARLAMRVAAILAGPSATGQITDNLEVVGEMTASGTLSLAMEGAFFGMSAAIVYLAARVWLPWTGWRRGVAFGALLLVTFGFVVMDPSNPDYRRFGSPAVNVGSFSVVYLIFGVGCATATDWLDRRLPMLTLGRLSTWRPALTGVALLPFGLIGVLTATFGGILFGGLASVTLFYGFVLGTPLTRLMLRRAGLTVPWPVTLAPRRRLVAVVYAAPLATLVIGMTLTGRAIGRILGVI